MMQYLTQQHIVPAMTAGAVDAISAHAAARNYSAHTCAPCAFDLHYNQYGFHLPRPLNAQLEKNATPEQIIARLEQCRAHENKMNCQLCDAIPDAMLTAAVAAAAAVGPKSEKESHSESSAHDDSVQQPLQFCDSNSRFATSQYTIQCIAFYTCVHLHIDTESVIESAGVEPQWGGLSRLAIAAHKTKMRFRIEITRHVHIDPSGKKPLRMPAVAASDSRDRVLAMMHSPEHRTTWLLGIVDPMIQQCRSEYRNIDWSPNSRKLPFSI